MNQPEGFIRVQLDVTTAAGTGTVSCLVCQMCQAMILQNTPQDFVEGHRLWHQHLYQLFKDFDERNSNKGDHK